MLLLHLLFLKQVCYMYIYDLLVKFVQYNDLLSVEEVSVEVQ